MRLRPRRGSRQIYRLVLPLLLQPPRLDAEKKDRKINRLKIKLAESEAGNLRCVGNLHAELIVVYQDGIGSRRALALPSFSRLSQAFLLLDAFLLGLCFTRLNEIGFDQLTEL